MNKPENVAPAVDRASGCSAVCLCCETKPRREGDPWMLCQECAEMITDDLDFFDDGCQRCGGKGYIVVCIDDMCHGAGECMHGNGEIPCPDCSGEDDREAISPGDYRYYQPNVSGEARTSQL